MTRTCSHPSCRTTLDEHPVECPHGLPFCQYCTWEDGCADCDREPWRAGLDDASRRAANTMGRPLVPPCRCGWPDESPHGVLPVRVPVLDLTGAPGVKGIEVSPTRRVCASCTHPIGPGSAAVVQRLTGPGSVLNRYHPECVVIA